MSLRWVELDNGDHQIVDAPWETGMMPSLTHVPLTNTPHYVGIDPGVRTAFVAISKESRGSPYRLDRRELIHESTAYQRLAVLLDEVGELRYEIEIEDFIGGGFRSRDAHITLKIIGFVVGYCELKGYHLDVRTPQSRKPYLLYSTVFWKSYEKTTSEHYKDALAHAFALADRRGFLDRREWGG